MVEFEHSSALPHACRPCTGYVGLLSMPRGMRHAARAEGAKADGATAEAPPAEPPAPRRVQPHPRLMRSPNVLRQTVALAVLQLLGAATAITVPLPRFSWEKLPVFLHTQNTSCGEWNSAAAARAAQYPLSYSGMTGMRQPNGRMISQEIAAPATCRRITALNSTTHTFMEINSVIDWPWNYLLHAGMVANPSWRLKRDNGSDWLLHGQWVYNLSNPATRQEWISTCLAATEHGCMGCFVDQSNDVEGGFGSSAAAKQYSRDHLATLVELNKQLEQRGKYAINNHLGDGGDHVQAMMIEDFAGSEKCIRLLQTVAARGIITEVHAGNQWARSQQYSCAHGGTNDLAAFLIGAGKHSYYHCTDNGFSTPTNWPEVPGEWLDTLPEYGYRLGAPLGLATRSPSLTGAANTSVWRRTFARGTRVEFDGGNGNGTIWWADGPVQVGGTASVNMTVVATMGCRWETDKPPGRDRHSSSSREVWGT